MDLRKPLIVGIDPGTTTGYAVLDTGGNLIEANSSKNLGLAELISLTTRFGKVIAVGTDKRRTPDLVYRFASKLGAKIIRPKEDLAVIEKKEMAKGFKTRNEHENDALASAFWAFRDIRHLIEKIDRLDEKNKEHVKELVVKKGMSIQRAIDYLNPKDARTEPYGEVEGIREPQSTHVNVDKLFMRLRAYEKEVFFLRNYVSKLKSRSAARLDKNSRIDINKKIDMLFKFKENRIRSYSNSLREKDAHIAALKQEVMRLTSIILDSKNYYTLKKLRNLGYLEFESKKMALKIEDGDILLVDDANIISKKTIEELNGKISIIIHNRPLSKRTEEILPFTLLSLDKLSVYDLGSFAVARREILDREINKKSVFRKIIMDYKKEKEAIITNHS